MSSGITGIPAVIHPQAAASLGDVLGIGVLSVDANLIVTGWNDWLFHATGKAGRDVIGRPLSDVDPSIPQGALGGLRRAAKGSAVVLSQAFHEYLLNARPPAGFEHMGRMQQSVRIVPSGIDGVALGATAFIEDVTERVARELSLRNAVKTAQEAVDAKSKIFTAMSHELRTPIGAISGYADLLATGIFGAVSEVQREQLVRIQNVASHLGSVVNEILSFARIDAGREEIDVAEVDACAVAEQARVAVEPLALAKGLTLSVERGRDPLPMQTDVVKLRQILINLLGNAIKFTEHGSIGLSVAATDDQTIGFTVTDTGVGIVESDLAKIFDPFVRVGRNRQMSGTGLGLSVSLGFARLLGGGISVTSASGQGSRFVVTIPRFRAPA